MVNITITNLLDFSFISLKYCPPEASFQIQGNWSLITPPGRNLPHYHYGGGESSLSFTIDHNGTDCVEKCLWLCALVYADGYDSEPPEISINWPGTVPSDSIWQIMSADYKITRHGNNGVPYQANQTLMLKRISKGQINHNTLRKV